MRAPNLAAPLALALMLATAAGGAACGGGADVPDEVSIDPVTIETDPLRLRVAAPGGEFVIDNFVEVAVATSFDPLRYYDPRDVEPAAFDWHVASRAVAYDEDTGELRLDTGVRITLEEGPIGGAASLVVDSSHVEDAVLVRLAFPRDVGEPIYGFGESFVSADASGTVREMQMRIDTESESGINETHVPVPLSLWPRRGAGVFVEDPRPAAFDVGAQREQQVLATFTLAEPGPLSAHLYTADQPLDLVRRYIDMSGKPAVPPMWAFAPQQWRNAHNESQEVIDDANAMRSEGIPGSIMWIDNPWQTAYNDFTMDEDRFAESQAMLDELHRLGYRVVVWSTPYVNKDGPTSGDFEEAQANDYLVRGPDDRPFVFPWQDGPGSLVDFTTPGATEWWRERIQRIIDRGIVGFKLDFGEDLVPNLGTTLSPWQLTGGTPQTLHSAYAHGYHDAYLGALPEGEGFLITRAGSYGEQTVNTCIWPGDLSSDFSVHGVDNGSGEINVGGLPGAVAAGLSLSVSGYPFFGSDIGGFRDGPTTTETLVRWSQYAALGTIMQLGGGGPSHNPWDAELFDPIALDVYRVYSRLHMDLVPYLYTLARRAGEDGTPVVRPTRFMHPEAASDDATYFVGDALFVAPVIVPGAREREVVLPPGEWVDWWTGEMVTGDGETPRTVPAPLDTLPLWRRVDAIVPMYARAADTLFPAPAAEVTSYADPAFARELRLLWRPGSGTATTTLFDGTSASAQLDGQSYVVSLTAGSQFDIVTLDLDGRSAPPTSVTFGDHTLVEADNLTACPAPGCWLAQADRLQIRLHLTGTGSGVVTVKP